MPSQNKSAPDEIAELLGDSHPLLYQLGSVDSLVTLAAAATTLQMQRVDSQPALARFLAAYRAQLLLPLELPAIYRAHQHASRNETSELLALDGELARHPGQQDFAAASRRVGQCQLQRLRPLRDERIVQRYLRAVEADGAQAWHTLVYGLTLALYSLPVRQGLLNYAHQTLRGFIEVAAHPLRLSDGGCRDLLEDACAGLPCEVEKLIAAPAAPRTR